MPSISLVVAANGFISIQCLTNSCEAPNAQAIWRGYRPLQSIWDRKIGKRWASNINKSFGMPCSITVCRIQSEEKYCEIIPSISIAEHCSLCLARYVSSDFHTLWCGGFLLWNARRRLVVLRKSPFIFIVVVAIVNCSAIKLQASPCRKRGLSDSNEVYAMQCWAMLYCIVMLCPRYPFSSSFWDMTCQF